MTDLSQIAYWLRILPHPEDLADALEKAAKIEQMIASYNDEMADRKAVLDKLNGDIAALEEEKTKKFHEVGSVVPEAQGHARDILEAAQAKAEHIKREADEYAAKKRAEGDDYFRRNIARIEKFRAELS